jgi:hypothetical protein
MSHLDKMSIEERQAQFDADQEAAQRSLDAHLEFWGDEFSDDEVRAFKLGYIAALLEVREL